MHRGRLRGQRGACGGSGTGGKVTVAGGTSHDLGKQGTARVMPSWPNAGMDLGACRTHRQEME